jgi:hypothetical protein
MSYSLGGVVRSCLLLVVTILVLLVLILVFAEALSAAIDHGLSSFLG